MDANGKVTYTAVQGASLNLDAQQLTTAIDDHSVTVNVTAENTYLTPNNELVIGGAFMGNTVTQNSTTGNTVVAEQLINPNVLEKMSTDYNKPGADTLHEVTEAYQGAAMSQKSGVSSPQAGKAGSVYPRAHNAATPQSGAVNQVIYDAQGKVLQPTASGGFPPNATQLKYKNTNGTTILSVP